MNFDQIVDAAIELLRRKQRLTYGALKRQFELDEGGLEDLKQELIRGQRVARDEDGAVLVWLGGAVAGAAAADATRLEAERRQLTIVFCDLADSTALSNRLDVEELRGVLRTFQDAAGAAVARHGGFINSYSGDGIVVFFGYPQAHEDDARRAVRAGLDVVASVGALTGLPSGQLRVRVGIATGIVVVGDVIGSGASREEAVVGNTSNLAARLQSVARPDEVVIALGTKKLLGPRFDCLDLGAQRLKGFSEPVPAWRVLGERSAEAVSQAGDAAARLPPMVDREVEFPVLMDCWQSACTGQARIVTLRGEAGLGKSRLSEALREAASAHDPLVLRFYCSARFQNTALYPVIRHIEHAAGLADDDSDDVRLAKLTAALEPGLEGDELAAAMPYFAALLGIATGERYPAIDDSPERQRELTLRALLTQIVNLARQRPLLILFEDLHWVDPTTLSLIDQLARHEGLTQLMLVATSRPEFSPPWAEVPRSLTLELSLLKRHHRSSIIEQHLGGKTFPPEILEHIVQKSDGIPLYVEELTKAMMESGLLHEQAGAFVLSGPMPAMTVPSTLHDSLLARLDRLAVVKEVAQACAAIGREFDYSTLAALLPMARPELDAALGRLIEAGLILGQGVPPDARYSFKHALIQDAAYDTMLRPRKQGLHARIAQILQQDPVASQRAPELLAHHLIEADQIESAVPCLIDAGLQASAGAAHTEACKHFEHGLGLLPRIKDEIQRHRLELRLRVHLGMSLAATRGFAAPEVEFSNQRARELCRLLGDNDELFWVLRGLCALYIVRSNGPVSRELSEHCVRLGHETGRDEFMVEALVMDGYVQAYAGNFARAREAMSRAVQISRSTDAGRYAYPTPQDPSVAALTLLAVASLVQGDETAAVEQNKDALRTAEALKRPFDQAYAHCFAAMFENIRGDAARAAHHAGVTLGISQRHGYAGWLAAGAMQLGKAKAALGEAQEAIALVGNTLPAWQGSGAETTSSYFLSGLAEGHRAADQDEQALAAVARGLEHAQHHDEHWYDAELLRLRGELLARCDDTRAQAAAAFQSAIELARSQGAHLFELRAAIGLMRLSGPEAPQARALLEQALARYPAQQVGAEQRQAAALLDEQVA